MSSALRATINKMKATYPNIVKDINYMTAKQASIIQSMKLLLN